MVLNLTEINLLGVLNVLKHHTLEIEIKVFPI